MPPPGSRLWIDRSARLLASGASPVAYAVFGVVRNKWLALHLDVSGIGVLAQIVSGQTWLGIASGMGMSLPVAQAVGAAGGRGDEKAARRAFWTAINLVWMAALIVTAAGLLLAPWISSALLGTPAHAGPVRVAMIGVVGIALSGPLQGLFAGRSDLLGPVTLAASCGIAGILFTVLMVPRWGLLGAALATSLLFVAGLVSATLLRGRAHAGVLQRPAGGIDRREARALLGVGAAAISLSLIDLGTLVGLRAHYVRVNGPAANGLLQAALAVSQQVGSVFYAYLSSYAFGKISAAAEAGGAGAIGGYTRRQWGPLLLAALALVAVAIVLASPLLHLLYSSRFDPARPLMAYVLFGEFARVGGQSWALGALPLGGRRLWLSIGLTQPVALGLGYLAFSRLGTGTMSLPYAYAAAGIVTLIASMSWMARAGVRPRGRDLALLVLALGGLGLLARWMAG